MYGCVKKPQRSETSVEEWQALVWKCIAPEHGQDCSGALHLCSFCLNRFLQTFRRAAAIIARQFSLVCLGNFTAETQRSHQTAPSPRLSGKAPNSLLPNSLHRKPKMALIAENNRAAIALTICYADLVAVFIQNLLSSIYNRVHKPIQGTVGSCNLDDGLSIGL